MKIFKGILSLMFVGAMSLSVAEAASTCGPKGDQSTEIDKTAQDPASDVADFYRKKN